MEILIGSFTNWLWSVLVNMSLKTWCNMDILTHELFMSGQPIYLDFLRQSSEVFLQLFKTETITKGRCQLCTAGASACLPSQEIPRHQSQVSSSSEEEWSPVFYKGWHLQRFMLTNSKLHMTLQFLVSGEPSHKAPEREGASQARSHTGVVLSESDSPSIWANYRGVRNSAVAESTIWRLYIKSWFSSCLLLM